MIGCHIIQWKRALAVEGWAIRAQTRVGSEGHTVIIGLIRHLPAALAEMEATTVQMVKHLGSRMLLAVIALKCRALCVGLTLVVRVIAVLTEMNTATILGVLLGKGRRRSTVVASSNLRLGKILQRLQLINCVAHIKPADLAIPIHISIHTGPIRQLVIRTANVAHAGTPRGSCQVLDLATPSSDTQ